MRINNENDLESITPTEDPDNVGFYIIPDFELFSISKDGIVLNRKKKRILKTYIGKTKYRVVNIFNDSIRSPQKLHRLLARTFIGRPSRHVDKKFEHLEVNHISGVRLDNLLNNLEWCTGVENVQHFRHTKNHILDKPVLAKNLITGAVLEFSSSKKCAEFFNIPRSSLHKTLRLPYCNKFYKDNHIFKFKDDKVWTLFPVEYMREIGKCEKSPVLSYEQIKEMILLKRKNNSSCSELSRIFNLDRATVRSYLNKYKDLVF